MISPSLSTHLLVVFLSHLPIAIAAPHPSPSPSSPSKPQQPPKFPSIRTFHSVGDSYAAGLGAGTDRTDYVCSRFSSSYPSLLHHSTTPPNTPFNSVLDIGLGPNPDRTFQEHACSGAKIQDVLEHQIPNLPDAGVDLLTITAGGNDIGLSPILNDCVYQFYFAGKGECEKAVDEAWHRIQGKAELYTKMRNLLEAVRSKMRTKKPKKEEKESGKDMLTRSDGVVYVTGYATFFGEADHTCDNVTWAVWRDIEAEKQYLDLELRRTLNAMVREVNDVLRRAVRDSGPGFRFIDYDDVVVGRKGRYCEEGVVEPDPNRLNLSFYEWGTVDDAEDAAEMDRTGDDVRPGSFEGDIARLIEKTLSEHPDWEFADGMGKLDKDKMRKAREEGWLDDAIWWLLPDKWKRVFHPRPATHEIIADLIVRDLEELEGMRRREAWLLAWAKVIGLVVLGVVVGVGVAGAGFGGWRVLGRTKRGGYQEVPTEDALDVGADVDADAEAANEVGGVSDEETLAEEPLAGPSSSIARSGPDAQVKSYNTFD
jgi:lysophospholipase L1-like esterase